MSSIRINRVYTRSGDTGETGLLGGQRISKSDLRVESYGEVDELNSHLGLLKEQLDKPLTELIPIIELLQQELFDIGAELATAPGSSEIEIAHVSNENVERLEKWCDKYNASLKELRSFILPGGSLSVAQFHICRTVCRRAERRVIALEQTSESGNRHIVRYLNRLSDLLFVLARWCLEQQNVSAGEWIKPEDRKIPSTD